MRDKKGTNKERCLSLTLIFSRNLLLLALALSTAPSFVMAQSSGSVAASNIENDLDTVFEHHLREYNRKADNPITVEEARMRIQTYREALKQFAGETPGNWPQLKAGFEIAMVGSNRGTPLVYNKDARSVYDAICRGRYNCQAGTDLFVGSSVMAWGPSHVIDENLSVIFSNGHIQPGYFSRDNTGSWRLNRIETTATAVAPQDLGLTGDLTQHGPLRVILAEDYLRMEANRISGISNERIVNEMLPEALNRVRALGVPVDELEELIRQVPAAPNKDLASGSPLAFGKVQVPEGDIPRSSSPGQVNQWPPRSTDSALKNHPWVEGAIGENEDFRREMIELDNQFRDREKRANDMLLRLESEFGPLVPEVKRPDPGTTQTPEVFWPADRQPRHPNSFVASLADGNASDANAVTYMINRSLTLREDVKRDPRIQARIESNPSFEILIDEFYDKELADEVKHLSGVYTGRVSIKPTPDMSETEVYGRGRSNINYLDPEAPLTIDNTETEAQFLLRKLTTSASGPSSAFESAPPLPGEVMQIMAFAMREAETNLPCQDNPQNCAVDIAGIDHSIQSTWEQLHKYTSASDEERVSLRSATLHMLSLNEKALAHDAEKFSSKADEIPNSVAKAKLMNAHNVVVGLQLKVREAIGAVENGSPISGDLQSIFQKQFFDFETDYGLLDISINDPKEVEAQILEAQEAVNPGFTEFYKGIEAQMAPQNLRDGGSGPSPQSKPKPPPFR